MLSAMNTTNANQRIRKAMRAVETEVLRYIRRCDKTGQQVRYWMMGNISLQLVIPF